MNIQRKIAVPVVVFTVIALLLVTPACRGGKSKAAVSERYTCPMHPTYIADRPGSCPICGMDLVKVSGTPAVTAHTVKELYTCPMHPDIHSESPGSCPICGMFLEKVKTESPTLPGRSPVEISPAAGQAMHLRLATVELRRLQREIRTSARISVDETRLHRVTAKIDGYIEKLHVDVTGQTVRRGQPLLTLYSPELLSAQQEFLSALSAAERLQGSTDAHVREDGARLVAAARRRLQLWDIDDTQIRRLEESRSAGRTMTLAAPAGGIVLNKAVLAGQMIRAGEELLVIADLSRVWAEADLYETDLPFVHTGMHAQILLPGRNDPPLTGRVEFLSPVLDGQTRTLRARLTLANPGGALKPEMYVEARLLLDLGQRLAVPEGAVLNDGRRAYVFVGEGAERLRPVEVRPGVRAGGYIEILSGVRAGDRVAAAGNFLVDSESSLKAAFQTMENGRDH